jgi:hypothetical protein
MSLTSTYSHEERFEQQFLKRIESFNPFQKPLFETFFMCFSQFLLQTLSDLLFVSKLESDYLPVIEEIGIKMFINVFCTSGANVSAGRFTNEMKNLELKPLLCTKLYCGPQQWRRFCNEFYSVDIQTELV